MALSFDGVIQEALNFAKEDAASRDPSHDFFHIERVLTMATKLAQGEKDINLEAVQLAAILHDVGDYKYSDQQPRQILEKFFAEMNYPQDKANFVISIVEGIGFKKELAGERPPVFPELAIVSDADRLDAIGAFGIARAFSFGAVRNSPIHDPAKSPNIDMTAQEYHKKTGGTTVNHFHEKLLKLCGLMLTEKGKELAKQRHAYMLGYLEQIQLEFQGDS